MSSDEWQEIRLGEFVNFRRGHDLPKIDMVEGPYPVVGSNGIIGFHNIYTTKAPCLSIGRSGNLGNPCYINKDCWAHNTTLYVDDFKGNDPKFAYYFLRTLDLGYFGGGSAVPTLNRNHIHPLQIRISRNLSEQKAIAATLSCLDDKIELNNRMNKTLEEMAQAIFKSWFVDFEPYQDGEFVDSELGRIPKLFTVSTIGDFSDVIDCLHSKKPNRCKSGKPFLQLNNIRDSGLLDMKDIYYISESDYLQWITRCEATEGDCVITNVGRVGAVSQIPEGIKAALGRNMTCVRCRKENPYPTFLIECLVSEQMKHEIEKKTDSGTILDALNVKSIPKLRFICPDKRSLDTFEKTARPIRQHMENIIRENRQISQLRDTLLPKLMSGEIRVPIQED